MRPCGISLLVAVVPVVYAVTIWWDSDDRDRTQVNETRTETMSGLAAIRSAYGAAGEPPQSRPDADAGCYPLSPSLAAGPSSAPSSGLVASITFSANFRWEVSSCSARS